GNKQHPWFDPTTLDRKFPMAYIGGQSAREHERIGRQLYELGRYLDERRPFESAAWHLGDAARLYRAESAKGEQAEAMRMRGLALLAVDEDEAAAKVLSDTLAAGGAGASPEASYLLGVARTRLAVAGNGPAAAAVEALERFAGGNPKDSRAPWAR